MYTSATTSPSTTWSSGHHAMEFNHLQHYQQQQTTFSFGDVTAGQFLPATTNTTHCMSSTNSTYPTSCTTTSTAPSADCSRLSTLRPSPLSQMSSAGLQTSASLFSSDVWEPPKPWSPKALTPISKHRPGHPYQKDDYLIRRTPPSAEDLGYYGSPQVDWTPPKLPACAHSTPEMPTIMPLSVSTLITTPSSGTPPNLNRDSGYGSDCSALFGSFSPTTSLYIHDGLDTSFGDVITALGTPPRIQMASEEADNQQGVGSVDGFRPLSDSFDDVIITGVSSLPEPPHQDMKPTFPLVHFSPPVNSPLTPLSPPSQPEYCLTQPEPSPTSSEAPPKTPEDTRASPGDSDSAPTKPKEPYFALIAKAILESADRKLVLGDIYDNIQDKYPYFRSAESSWRNVVRHNLSVNDCFVKVGRAANGRGCYWGIHPSCVSLFAGGDFRRREARRLVNQYEEELKLQHLATTGKENLIPGSYPMAGVNHLLHAQPNVQAPPNLGQYQYSMPYAGYPRNTASNNGLHMYPGQYRQALNKDTHTFPTNFTNSQSLYRRTHPGLAQSLSTPSMYGKTVQQLHYQ